jgi:hypothetical protein
MRILTDKLARTATITSEGENVSYPASNLAHPYATVKYKARSYLDLITFMFPAPVSVDCIFFTYSNAEDMEIRLYKSDSSLLRTVTVDCTNDSGATYFDKTDLVRWIEVEASTSVSNDLRIGSIEFGVAKQFYYPLADFVPELISQSTREESDGGQVSFQYIEPRIIYKLKYTNVAKEDYILSTLETFRTIDRGYLWADVTEENHTLYKPIYCVSNLLEGGERKNDRISFNITLTEAR